MGELSRRKGRDGEREVANRFEGAGWHVRGLESGGDWLCVSPNGNLPTFHVETKRQERLRIPEWIAQAEREAAPNAVPVVAFRQSRGQWYAVLALDDLLQAIQ